MSRAEQSVCGNRSAEAFGVRGGYCSNSQYGNDSSVRFNDITTTCSTWMHIDGHVSFRGNDNEPACSVFLDFSSRSSWFPVAEKSLSSLPSCDTIWLALPHGCRRRYANEVVTKRLMEDGDKWCRVCVCVCVCVCLCSDRHHCSAFQWQWRKTEQQRSKVRQSAGFLFLFSVSLMNRTLLDNVTVVKVYVQVGINISLKTSWTQKCTFKSSGSYPCSFFGQI